MQCKDELSRQLADLTTQFLARGGRIKTPEDFLKQCARQRQFYAEALGYAATNGYSPDWAASKCYEKVGHYPSALFINDPPKKPSAATIKWLEANAAEFAVKRRRGRPKRAKGT